MNSDCSQKKNVAAICKNCGDLVQGLLHVPVGAGGWFCSACCPACRPQGQERVEVVQRAEE